MQQLTQGAELNSEATLNCNGKEFKCFNSTHFQSCSLTERSGQQPQWTINGIIMPCSAGQLCSDEIALGCVSVGRIAEPLKILTQIPVQVTVEKELPVEIEAPVEAQVELVPSPAKSLPAKEPAIAMPEPIASTTEAATSASLPEKGELCFFFRRILKWIFSASKIKKKKNRNI